MISVLNLTVILWLLLATCARLYSAHAGYQVNYDEGLLSYDESNGGEPVARKNVPFDDKLTLYYNLDVARHNSMASATPPPTSAPRRPVSSLRDGWKPIVRSPQTNSERDRLAKIQPLKEADGVKRERAGGPRQSRTASRGRARPGQQRQFQRYDDLLDTERNTPKRTPPKDDLRAFQYLPTKKDKLTLSENDVMWMHYGPPISGHRHQQIRQRGEGVPPASKIGQRSYEVRESDDEDVQSPPQNVYQIIDRSTAPTFAAEVAGPIKRQTSTEAWLDDESSGVSGVQTYKFGYEDRLVGEPSPTPTGAPFPEGLSRLDVQSFDDEDDFSGHSSTKHAASRYVGGFVNFAATSTSSPAEDEHLNSIESSDPVPNRITVDTSTAFAKPVIKSGRLLDSPIVIVESPTTTLTPEYYRQLFDSFSSGHYRLTDTDVPPLNEKNPPRGKEKRPPASSTVATTALASGAASTNQSEHQQSLGGTPKRNETEKSNSVFFTITSRQLMDLLPETLRANLIAVKRVLIDCYTPNDNNETKPSSVNCFKKITFDLLDKAIDSDVVKLTDTVSLVKDNKTSNGQARSAASPSTDKTEWLPNMIERIQKLFSTHALKVKLMNSHESDSYQVEGRRRNRHTFRRVFPVVASIYMIVTSVLMPLVFQFMAVMAGKSFMVGKIALLFALFTGFNKFLSVGIENILPWYLQPNHASPSPPPPPAPHLLPVPYPVPFHHNNHQKKDNRKKDTDVYNYSYTTKRVPINYTYYTLE